MKPDEQREFTDLKRQVGELQEILDDIRLSSKWMFTLPVILSKASWFTVSKFSAYASGTVYSLTTSAAKLNFGTIDPAITITQPGKYLIFARARIDYNGATFAAPQTITIKIRRTNNTAADLSDATASLKTRIITTQSDTAGIIVLPVTVYETDANDDELEVWGSIGTGPSAGSVDAVQAEIVAIRVV